MPSEDILSQTPPVADVLVKYGSDDNHFADLRVTLEHSPSPLAIMIHGGFWRERYDLVHTGHLCAALTRAGIATLNVEYRRVGNLGGGWPASLCDIEDAFQAISDLASKYRLDLDRVLVAGHSAGGHLALALAARQNHLRGVLALAPISDLRHAYELHLSNDAVGEFLGGTPSQVPEHYSQASPIELEITVPQVLIHGTDDDTVPISMNRAYRDRKLKRGEKVSLVELACGHFELIDPSSAAWEHVQRAALALLGM